MFRDPFIKDVGYNDNDREKPLGFDSDFIYNKWYLIQETRFQPGIPEIRGYHGGARIIMEKANREKPFRFSIALIFPVEIRDYVGQVDRALSQLCAPEMVFYDDRFLPEIAGFDDDTLLQKFYHDQSEFIVVFLCREHERKAWSCNVEWGAVEGLIEKRGLSNRNSILLLGFDRSDNIPGVQSLDAVPNVSTITPQQTAEIIWQSLQIIRREALAP